MLTFIHYVEVYFTIALLDCVHYNEDFGNSRLCSIQFTVILDGFKKIVRYIDVRSIEVPPYSTTVAIRQLRNKLLNSTRFWTFLEIKFAPMLVNLKSFQWTRNSGIL